MSAPLVSLRTKNNVMSISVSIYNRLCIYAQDNSLNSANVKTDKKMLLSTEAYINTNDVIAGGILYDIDQISHNWYNINILKVSKQWFVEFKCE